MPLPILNLYDQLLLIRWKHSSIQIVFIFMQSTKCSNLIFSYNCEWPSLPQFARLNVIWALSSLWLSHPAPCLFPPCSTMHLVLFLLVVPCTLSFSSLVYHAKYPFPHDGSTLILVIFLKFPHIFFSLFFSSSTWGRNPWVCFSGAHQQHSKMICYGSSL